MQDYIMYKEKPLVRCENQVYYGSPDDKYYVCITLDDMETMEKMTHAKKAVIELFQNQNGIDRKNKIIKKANREGLYAALDIGAYWLFDALSWK